MIKIVIFLIFLVGSSTCFSQQNTNLFNDTLPRLNFSIQGGFDYGSNFASNSFLNHFIYGGEIDRDDKSLLYKNLNGNNTVGGDVSLAIQVEIPFDTLFKRTNLSLVFGLEHTEHFDAKLSNDLVKLIFDGNKQFAGSYADIGNTNFNYFNYQQINFGLINYKRNNDKPVKEGVIFSVIKAQEHQAITIPRGSLFTEQFGNELIFDLNYVYNGSDTTKTGILAFNGIGISTDFFTEFYLKNGGKIKLNIDDLGFIQWSNKSIQIEADTIISFDGVEIENIFDINDSLISSFSRDSLLEYVSTKKGIGGYAIALPTTFNISYLHTFSSKVSMSIGVRYKILSNFFPLIYSNIQYSFSKSFIVQGKLLYGGYGKFNMGITLAKQFKEKYQIILGTNHLGSYVVPELTYSNNGFLGLKMYF